jgi:hypothetical protein
MRLRIFRKDASALARILRLQKLRDMVIVAITTVRSCGYLLGSKKRSFPR